MAKKEFKIDETFQLGFVKLKVDKYPKDVNPCCRCYISGLTTDCRIFKHVIGECIGKKREDKTDVVFVKVEE